MLLAKRIRLAFSALIVVMAFGLAPHATAAETPIGNLGDTLRVQFDDFVADVTVHDVLPAEVPPGWGWNGSPRWRAQGSPWRANVTVNVIKAPSPYKLAIATTFRGVTPYADAYTSKHTSPRITKCCITHVPSLSAGTGKIPCPTTFT